MRTRSVLAGALTMVTLVGCAAGPTPRTVGEPTAAEKIEPPPPLLDVAGELTEVTVSDLSRSASGLWPDGSRPDAPVPIDQPAVDASVAAAVVWVDAHLTDVQAGGPGHLGEAGLTEDPTVTSGLTNPDHRVTTVTYHATVGALGGPEWIRLSTTVQREDGEGTATFVFLPDGGDEVVLLAAGAGDGTLAPPAAPAEGDPGDGETEGVGTGEDA